MLKTAVGHSCDPDSETAVREVLDQCLAALGGEIPQAGVLFAALDFEHSVVLQHINQTFPGIQLIGGTSDGELSSILEFQQDSLVLILFCSDEVEFTATVGREVSSDPVAIVQQAAELAKAKATATPQLCLTTPESLTISGAAILRGLKQGLGETFPIIGGSTGDQWKFERTYQFFGQEVLTDAVPILLLSGNVLFGHGISSGWTPIGRKGIATKANDNVLYEVDGQPALNFYQKYLGDIRPTPEYRLAVFEPESSHWYMRTSNGSYDETIGSITFFADIPEHSEIQVVRSNRDEIVSSAQVSMQQALSRYPGTNPTVGLFFTCTGRMRVLGTRAKEEYSMAEASMPPNFCCAGFYTYGEIAPLRTNGSTQFHNETFVTLVLGTK